ncbi:hypothetical protein GCM10010365_71540 [Streptomyces poonensis]|uniref:Uncharacterized protein n=1 Tax=Streptomyces poonensis TaxID=68255 RepID=A0A918QC72_9ACTN|nr:hypothetical protein GCM10010365_71540 [Streptomyces poonensis]GLJ93031.1 hypothetical protein GCM10017589_56430 [Streptomyces poonensis]
MMGEAPGLVKGGPGATASQGDDAIWARDHAGAQVAAEEEDGKTGLAVTGDGRRCVRCYGNSQKTERGWNGHQVSGHRLAGVPFHGVEE